MTNNKFSQKFIEYVKNEEDESNTFNIKKKVLDYDSKLAYQWNNIALTILFDIDCIKNPILSKIKDDCFNIEKIIKIDNFTDENTKNNIVYPSEYYIINYLLPKLDSLSSNEIEMLKKAQMIKDGPLYDKFKYMRIPGIFIDLFS
jgi:hypothetical protein